LFKTGHCRANCCEDERKHKNKTERVDAETQVYYLNGLESRI